MIENVVLLVPFLLCAGVLIAAPRLSPRHMFFAVRVAPAFRSTTEGNRALRRYELSVVMLAVAGVAFILFWQDHTARLVGPPLLLMSGAAGSAVWVHRQLRGFGVAPPTKATVELTTQPDRLPRFFWASLIPPVLLAATAVYLNWHWAEIPLRYPSHWGANGRANGWSVRSVRGVYGPLWFAGLWMLWFTGMAFACWYGSRRTGLRLAFAKIMIAAEFLFGILFPLVALTPFYRPNPAVIVSILVAAVGGMMAYSLLAVGQASKSPANEGGGVVPSGPVYYDRNDPSLLIARADGLGYAPNLAHVTSWMLMLTPFGILYVGIKFIF